MLKIKEGIDLKELEKFIGVEIYTNSEKYDRWRITGIANDDYLLKDLITKTALGIEVINDLCFKLDDGDKISIWSVGSEYNEFVPSKQLEDLIKAGLVEKVGEK